MALDWNQEVSFNGLAKRKTKADVSFPSKTSMNLKVADQKKTDLRKAIPLALLLIAAVALFTKFGVIDFYGQTTEKQSELAAAQAQLAATSAGLGDYEAVQSEYNRYEAAAAMFQDSEVDAIGALSLVDAIISPAATVTSVDLRGHTLTVNMSGITLDAVGNLVSALYDQVSVENVSVSTAQNSTATSDAVSAVMTITLNS